MPLTVDFNTSATLSAVQALLRAITWANISLTPSTIRRYIRFSITDNTGKVSGQPVKTVDLTSNIGLPPQPLILAANNLYLKYDDDGSNLDMWINSNTPGAGVPTQKGLFAAMSSITFKGAAGNDVLELDLTNGMLGNISFQVASGTGKLLLTGMSASTNIALQPGLLVAGPTTIPLSNNESVWLDSPAGGVIHSVR